MLDLGLKVTRTVALSLGDRSPLLGDTKKSAAPCGSLALMSCEVWGRRGKCELVGYRSWLL
jgi:hypothetical protein